MVLGEDNGDIITVKTGRFGPYVQRGEATKEAPKPPRASLPKGWTKGDMDLDKALQLLNLPREIGPHPEDGVMIEAGIGRYGPFIKHGSTYANIKDVDEVFTIGMNRAMEELAKKAARGGGATRAAAKPLKELGEHPTEGGAVNVMDGRYGPYIKFGKINATLPKGVEPGDVTMDMAVQLIAEKAAKAPKNGHRKRRQSRNSAVQRSPNTSRFV
jgi:DNA topoisomerase-1